MPSNLTAYARKWNRPKPDAIAFRERAGRPLITGVGTLAAGVASAALIYRLLDTDSYAPIFLALLVLATVPGRPLLLRYVPT